MENFKSQYTESKYLNSPLLIQINSRDDLNLKYNYNAEQGISLQIQEWHITQPEDLKILKTYIDHLSLNLKSLKISFLLGIIKENLILPTQQIFRSIIKSYNKIILNLILNESQGSFYKTETYSVKVKQSSQFNQILIEEIENLINMLNFETYFIVSDQIDNNIIKSFESSIIKLPKLNKFRIRYDISYLHYNTSVIQFFFFHFCQLKKINQIKNSSSYYEVQQKEEQDLFTQQLDNITDLGIELIASTEKFFLPIFLQFCRFLESMTQIEELQLKIGCQTFSPTHNQQIQQNINNSLGQLRSLKNLKIHLLENADFEIMTLPLFTSLNLKTLVQLEIINAFADSQNKAVSQGLENLVNLQKFVYICFSNLNLSTLAQALHKLEGLIEIEITISVLENSIGFLYMHQLLVYAAYNSRKNLQRLHLSFKNLNNKICLFMSQEYMVNLAEILVSFSNLLDLQFNDETDKIIELKIFKENAFKDLNYTISVRNAMLMNLISSKKELFERKFFNRYKKFAEYLKIFDFESYAQLQ